MLIVSLSVWRSGTDAIGACVIWAEVCVRMRARVLVPIVCAACVRYWAGLCFCACSFVCLFVCLNVSMRVRARIGELESKLKGSGTWREIEMLLIQT